MRCGVSRLADLRCDLEMPAGIAGTGGALCTGDMAPPLLGALPPGEGDLKLRSVMEELLFCRTMAFRGAPMMALLPVED